MRETSAPASGREDQWLPVGVCPEGAPAARHTAYSYTRPHTSTGQDRTLTLWYLRLDRPAYSGAGGYAGDDAHAPTGG